MFRIAIGTIAVLFLAFGIMTYLSESAVNPIVPGMLVRIGALMGVIWLAYPQLEKSKDRIPGFVIGIGMACLLLIAARPKISHVILTVGALAIAVSSAMKLLTKLADDGKRRQ